MIMFVLKGCGAAVVSSAVVVTVSGHQFEFKLKILFRTVAQGWKAAVIA